MKLFTDKQIENGEADDYEPVILAGENGVEYPGINNQLNDIVSEVLEKQSEALENALKADLVEILRQMILSGDITRYCTIAETVLENGILVSNTKQKLVYVPGQRVMELEARILELEEENGELKEEIEDLYKMK